MNWGQPTSHVEEYAILIDSQFSYPRQIEAIDFPKRTGQAYIRFGSLEASEAGLALSATLSFKERPVRAEYAMEERKVKPKSEYFKSEDTDTDTFFIGKHSQPLKFQKKRSTCDTN